MKAIIEKVKGYADLIWLENLNLRGQFKGGIMTYIREKHPDLFPLYEEIYNKKRLDYWQALEHCIIWIFNLAQENKRKRNECLFFVFCR